MIPGISYMIRAIDCDGTLCTNCFPDMGEPNIAVINYAKACKMAGDKLILFTCRGGKDLETALAWCANQGLEFDAVNDDLPDVKNTDFGKTKSIKVYYNELVDDKATNARDIGSETGLPSERMDLISTILR